MAKCLPYVLLVLVCLSLACSPAPGPSLLGPCALDAGSKFSTDLYQAIFDQIVPDGNPVYRGWQTYPVTPGNPPEEMVVLGLPVHGRWATTYVNETAVQPLKKAADADDPPYFAGASGGLDHRQGKLS